MDYETMINTCRQIAVAYAHDHFGEDIADSELDNVWTGNLMELYRVMFLDIVRDRIYVINFNILDAETATVKTYSRDE